MPYKSVLTRKIASQITNYYKFDVRILHEKLFYGLDHHLYTLPANFHTLDLQEKVLKSSYLSNEDE